MDQLRDKLQRSPTQTVRFLAHLPDQELRDLYKLMTGRDWDDKRYVYSYEPAEDEIYYDDNAEDLMANFGVWRHDLRCFELGKEVVID
jgi:hypothetical protein